MSKKMGGFKIMGERHIGRQPIIDTRAKIAAYDLLYRETGHGDDDNAITASVISNLMGTIGIDTILGKHFGFIRINRDFLNYDLIHSLPREKIVYALLPEIEVDETLLTRLRELKKEGYSFALNDSVFDGAFMTKTSRLYPLLSFMKIDVSRSDLRLLGQEIDAIKRYGVTLIGAKIETHDAYNLCRSMGFDYFQGYFISQPNVITHAGFSAEQQAIIQLWNMLQSDAEMPTLVNAFEQNHVVSMKLLQFINSAAFSLRSPVSSIAHVLTLMGRDPISRWIMLMMFADEDQKESRRVPLLLMVINRTELMHGLIEKLNSSATKAEKATAYFVGMLSLVHLLFHMPQQEILSKLNISKEVEDALLHSKGYLGGLLDLVRSIELNDMESIRHYLGKTRFDYSDIEPVIIAAMQKVNQMEKEMER